MRNSKPDRRHQRDWQAAVRDPTHLLHRYDERGDNFHFIPVSRAVHRQCSFLTDDYLPKDVTPLILPRHSVVRSATIGHPEGSAIAHPSAQFPAQSPAPIHFIFHSAYCCSTLLARALDIDGRAMSLKEPMVVNDIVGWKRRGAPPPRVAEVLDQAMQLLAKPFGKGEAVIVKPSNVAVGLMRVILAMRPDCGAIILTSPLKRYLGSIAMKGLWGRLWARTLLIGLIEDHMIAPFGMSQADLLGLSDLQIAALGWLAQQKLFMAILREHPTRVKSLNSEHFLAAPTQALQALSALYRLKLSADEIANTISSPNFTRHAKRGHPFDAAHRRADQHQALTLHADEIDKVYHWAEVTAKAMAIPMDLDTTLL